MIKEQQLSGGKSDDSVPHRLAQAEACREIDAILMAKRLAKRYHTAGKVVNAVIDVSLSIKLGEILAFLGPNGAGKTTTIKMIAGLIVPDEGEVFIDGYDVRSRYYKSRIGAVLEGNRNVYWRLNVRENLEYFGVLKGLTLRGAKERSKYLTERFGLSDKRDTAVRFLSRGMQQKVAIAVALIHRPRVLLLDEPTLGLDVEAAEEVKGLIKEEVRGGCAVLLTTHQLDVAEALADRVSIIREGRVIAENSLQELLKQFSGEAYIVEFEGELSINQTRALSEMNAVVEGNRVLFAGDYSDIYTIIEAIKPLKLRSVRQDGTTLTEVFLKLIKD